MEFFLYMSKKFLGTFEILILICWNPVILCFQGFWISWRCLCYAMWLFFRASGKLLELFLVSNPNDVGDFHQIAVLWSDHDMILPSCCFKRSRVATLYKSIRSFKNIDRDRLLGAAASLDCSAVWFMVGVNENVECFYTMLGYICACATDQGHRRR
jgi:hypothetical protein